MASIIGAVFSVLNTYIDVTIREPLKAIAVNEGPRLPLTPPNVRSNCSLLKTIRAQAQCCSPALEVRTSAAQLRARYLKDIDTARTYSAFMIH